MSSIALGYSLENIRMEKVRESTFFYVCIFFLIVGQIFIFLLNTSYLNQSLKDCGLDSF